MPSRISHPFLVSSRCKSTSSSQSCTKSKRKKRRASSRETGQEIFNWYEFLAETYATPVRCISYDAREILIEKSRAILTRQAAKGRDVLDLFLLDRELDLHVENYLPQIEEKTKFSIEDRKRYRKQLDGPETRFTALLQEAIRPLLIKALDLDDFQEYRKDVVSMLREEAKKLGKTEP